MGKLIVVNNLSLDGVMQAPGRPDEAAYATLQLVDSVSTTAGVMIATYRPTA